MVNFIDTAKDLLKVQDYFGVTPHFFHKGKNKYQHLFGAYISLVINMCCLAMAGVLLEELFSRRNPSSTLTTSTKERPLLTIGKDLIISFGLLNQAMKVMYNESIYTYNAIYQIIKPGPDGKLTFNKYPLTPINCSILNENIYNKNGFSTEFQSNDLGNYQCYNQTDNGLPLIIGGNYGSEFYGVFTISILKCKNSTNNSCASPEEIDKNLNKAYFEVFFLDHYMDTYNYKEPIQRFSNSFYYQTTPNLMKFITSSFNALNLFSDNGLIFSKKKSFKTFKLYEKYTDVMSLDDEEQVLKLWVESSSLEENYYRSYIKVPEICGSIGGIMKGLQFLGIIIYAYFQDKVYRRSLVNHLIEFKNEGNVMDFSGLYKKKRTINNSNISSYVTYGNSIQNNNLLIENSQIPMFAHKKRLFMGSPGNSFNNNGPHTPKVVMCHGSEPQLHLKKIVNEGHNKSKITIRYDIGFFKRLCICTERNSRSGIEFLKITSFLQDKMEFSQLVLGLIELRNLKGLIFSKVFHCEDFESDEWFKKVRWNIFSKETPKNNDIIIINSARNNNYNNFNIRSFGNLSGSNLIKNN
ncbi:MAG: hypothetical protein MJ252_11925 [archaeon]|nr:hypothetical protein [archaeon]